VSVQTRKGCQTGKKVSANSGISNAQHGTICSVRGWGAAKTAEPQESVIKKQESNRDQGENRSNFGWEVPVSFLNISSRQQGRGKQGQTCRRDLHARYPGRPEKQDFKNPLMRGGERKVALGSFLFGRARLKRKGRVARGNEGRGNRWTNLSNWGGGVRKGSGSSLVETERKAPTNRRNERASFYMNRLSRGHLDG